VPRAPVPRASVRDLIGSDDVDVACSVQRRLSDDRLAAGARIVGRKIGCTSLAVQRQLGADRSAFGVLDDMDVTDSPEVPSGRLLQPKTEAEVAFVLAADLAEGPFDAARVRSAVAHAVAALESVDSRIAGWDISFGDSVADNASIGLFVFGSRRRPLRPRRGHGSPRPLATWASRYGQATVFSPEPSDPWCRSGRVSCISPSSADRGPSPPRSAPGNQRDGRSSHSTTTAGTRPRPGK
jgi:hypothetical protein